MDDCQVTAAQDFVGANSAKKDAELLPPSRIPLAVTLLLGVVLIFWNLGGSDLTHWDEGRTAERAREILVFNDWLTKNESDSCVAEELLRLTNLAPAPACRAAAGWLAMTLGRLDGP